VLGAFPGDERIAVIATGGLSHEPGGPRYFWVDEEFDRWFLGLLAKGDHATLLAECTLERMEAAGSGGTAELLSWFLVLAMTHGPADVLAYMPAVARAPARWASGAPGPATRWSSKFSTWRRARRSAGRRSGPDAGSCPSTTSPSRSSRSGTSPTASRPGPGATSPCRSSRSRA